MYPFPTLDHDQLLTLARKAEGAARDHDPARIEHNATHLFEALVDHVVAEHPALARVAPGEARVLDQGQQRVVGLVAELAAMAARRPAVCRCGHLAADVVAELTLQADGERHALFAAAGY